LIQLAISRSSFTELLDKVSWIGPSSLNSTKPIRDALCELDSELGIAVSAGKCELDAAAEERDCTCSVDISMIAEVGGGCGPEVE
jgi:hypothetical protein